MMKKLKITASISDFAALREDDYYYVDKTDDIYKLASEKGYYFLSRPRRFGKSLIISTLQYLFEGHESLFQGLAIHQKWDWSQINPVIRLSFSGGNLTHPQGIEKSIINQLSDVIIKKEGDSTLQTILSSDAPEALRITISHLYKTTEQPVVVLIDEYDKPILDAITDVKLAEANRVYLSNVYGILKDSTKYIRFVFLTGITKFSKVSLFSGLNNLKDITLNPQYATICGFTDNELGTVFAPELEGLGREKIRHWYNGYSWRGEKVYNPYSILKLFRSREFQDWWFESGTPTYLYQLLLKKAHSAATLNRLENFWIRAAALSTFDIDKIQIEALLFQSGYLTMVEERVNRHGKKKHRLQFPNFEVRQSFYQKLLEHLVEDEQAYDNAIQQGEKLVELLGKGHFDAFQEALSILLHGIPYQLCHPGNIHHYEGVYAIALYAMFADLGLTIRAEAASSHGRSDIVLLHAGQVFVLELKMAKDQRETEKILDQAMQQIQDRKYGEEYKSRGEPIHLIALAFGIKERNIVGMKRERLM